LKRLAYVSSPHGFLLGDVYVARLNKANMAFRLDIDHELPFHSHLEAVEKLIGNDVLRQSYPESLRLAHILCTFTANEILAMQHFITRRHGIQIINRPDMHRLLFWVLREGRLRMKLYKKEGNIVQILSFPNENAEKGDYLIVEDADVAKALIVQVIDVQFAAVPGVLEELLRTLPDGGELIRGEDIDPLEIAPHITYIQDASLLICKIRATLEKDVLSPSSSWLPSRSQSLIRKLSVPALMKLAKVDGRLPIILGGTKDSSLLTIDATQLDGTLNIITGKKGCGKSHLSKLLIASLVGYKATVVIFDLNGEYGSIGMTNDGRRNLYYDKIYALTPAQNFKVAIDQLHMNVVMGILVNALHLPGTSAREFKHIWKGLKIAVP